MEELFEGSYRSPELIRDASCEWLSLRLGKVARRVGHELGTMADVLPKQEGFALNCRI